MDREVFDRLRRVFLTTEERGLRGFFFAIGGFFDHRGGEVKRETVE